MTNEGYRAPTQRFLVAIGFAVVLGMSALSVWLIGQSRGVNTSVDHSLTVKNLLANLRADTRRVESSQRGLLLTERPYYLDDFTTKIPSLLPALDQIAALTGDNPRQIEIIAGLRASITEKKNELATTIELNRAGRRQDALAMVGTDRGLKLMDTITDQITASSDEEDRLLAERRGHGRRVEIYLFVVNLSGALSIAALAYVSFLLFRRSSLEILESRAALQQLNAQLEQRVEERTADLQEANTEIERFAYVVTHDLRSPLVNIMGFTSELEALRDGVFRRLEAAPEPAGEPAPEPAGENDGGKASVAALRADFDEAIHFIQASIAKMDRLVNAILKLARVGRRELQIQPVDLNELVDTIIADFHHRVRERGTEIEIERLPTVRNDRLALEQILSNLLDNALKYLRTEVPGRIVVRCEETGTAIRLQVADNGRGIEAQDRERIFELFRRSGLQDRPGEGIGLAHSRTLARRIGGALTVAARPGGGSVFTLALSKAWMARQTVMTGEKTYG